MAFFHEFRQRLRVRKWRKLRARLYRLERHILSVETAIMEADPDEHEELAALLSVRRRARNQTLRQLRSLETKERSSVQA